MASAKLLVFVACLVISSATANAGWTGPVVVPSSLTVNNANRNAQSNAAYGAVGGNTNTGTGVSLLNGNAVNLASPVDNAGTNGIASGGGVAGETNQVAAVQAGRHLLNWKPPVVVVPQTVTANNANRNAQSNTAAGAVGGNTNTDGLVAVSALNGNAANIASPVDNAGTNGISAGGSTAGETNQLALGQVGRHLLNWKPPVVVVPQTVTANNANGNAQSNSAAGAVGGNTNTNGLVAASALNGNAVNLASPVDNAGTNGIASGGKVVGETNQVAALQAGRHLLNWKPPVVVVPQTTTVNNANRNAQSNGAAGAVGGNTNTNTDGGLVGVSLLNGNAANIASPVDNAGTNGISAGGSTAGETNQLALGQVGRRLLNWKPPVVVVPQTATFNNANGNAQSNSAAGAVGGNTNTAGGLLGISAGNGNAANIASPVDNAGTNGIAAGGSVVGVTNQAAVGQLGR